MTHLHSSRFDFYFRSGLAKYFRSHADIYVVQSAAMIRYRRSLGFLMPFRLHTRLVWFDDRALYFEQRFISTHDNFVRAIGLCKNTAVNCNVPEVMRDHFGHERPLRCPEWLRAFLEANECGSQQLKLEQEQNLNT